MSHLQDTKNEVECNFIMAYFKNLLSKNELTSWTHSIEMVINESGLNGVPPKCISVSNKLSNTDVENSYEQNLFF